jgi:hypothetical protein
MHLHRQSGPISQKVGPGDKATYLANRSKTGKQCIMREKLNLEEVVDPNAEYSHSGSSFVHVV